MDEHELNQRLSRISTCWTVLIQAHQGGAETIAESQRLLLQRYAGAVYRYLLAITRDADTADELAQEFALRFLRGDFRQADPRRGRFRDFLKTALRNLVIDHYRRQQARPRPLPLNDWEPVATAAADDDLDRRFLESWRKELLNRAWEELARFEQTTRRPYHTVLRFRAAHPDLRSGQLAERLSTDLGRPVTAVWVRTTLHRAREQFATFLLDDVARSLEGPAADRLAEELIDLGLLEYCRPALEKRGLNGPA